MFSGLLLGNSNQVTSSIEQIIGFLFYSTLTQISSKPSSFLTVRGSDLTLGVFGSYKGIIGFRNMVSYQVFRESPLFGMRIEPGHKTRLVASGCPSSRVGKLAGH